MKLFGAYNFLRKILYKTLLAALLISPLIFLVSLKIMPVKQKPVVIELFTSEGCSSCPPADRLLQKTVIEAAANHQPVFALAFHVDYWNRLGWVDSFSNKRYSERQQDYVKALHTQGAYTPEVVVNGVSEFVGGDEEALQSAVAAERSKYTDVSIAHMTAYLRSGKLIVSYQLAGDISNYDVKLAVVTKHCQTEVKRGENQGRLLTHTDVVRRFTSLKATTQGDVDFDWAIKENSAVIIFLQQRNTYEIMDAAMSDVE